MRFRVSELDAVWLGRWTLGSALGRCAAPPRSAPAPSTPRAVSTCGPPAWPRACILRRVTPATLLDILRRLGIMLEVCTANGHDPRDHDPPRVGWCRWSPRAGGDRTLKLIPYSFNGALRSGPRAAGLKRQGACEIRAPPGARGRGRALEYEGRPISGVGFNNYRGFRLQAARLVSRVSVHRLATLRLTRTTTG